MRHTYTTFRVVKGALRFRQVPGLLQSSLGVMSETQRKKHMTPDTQILIEKYWERKPATNPDVVYTSVIPAVGRQRQDDCQD